MSEDTHPEETDANPLSRRNWGYALRALGYLAAGFAILFLLAVVLAIPEDVGYELRGTVVSGKVERVEGRAGDRLVTYSFVDHEGERHTGTTRFVTGGPRRGDEIAVQYRTAEPGNHRAARDSKLRQQAGTGVQTALFAGMMTLVFLTLVFLVNRRDSIVRVVAWLGRVLPGGGRRTWKRHRPAAEDDDSPTFPFAWEKALRKNMGLYARLDPTEQKLLQDLVLDFVPAREWVGTDGLEITDEIKATVAGQACLLLLGIREHDLFASVASIILHPGTFHRPTHTPMDAGGTALESRIAVLGEAWYRGPVLLSWREVLAGGRDPDGGSNVVYHEFAHQLDFQGLDAGDSLSEAARADRRRWVEVMGREFAALVEAAEHGRATLLDHYGATDPREFFAVSTECFFERPIEMEAAYPALYEVLRSFYGQDTAARLRRYREAVVMLRHREHA